jgi:predicted alpha/beta-fold hydrolase
MSTGDPADGPDAGDRDPSRATGQHTRSTFRAPWWLPSAHLQTLWAPLLRRGPHLSLRRERIELPDGDFLDLDWTRGESGPIVLIVHGLEGSSASPYARGLLAAVERNAWRGVVMHFRGCSGEPNRLDRTYHSGDTGDVAHVAALLRERAAGAPVAAVGYSMGGNVLLKWLGEQGEPTPLAAAVAVCVPFTLAVAAQRLDRGFSRFYQWRLIGDLRRKLRRKYSRRPSPVDLHRVSRCRNFWEFDDQVTAPLHGFRDVHDYYARSSSRQYLHGIETPTLIIHAGDDPFMTPALIPQPHELSPSTELELSPQGGHVGFIQGPWPWRSRYWLEHRIPEFLRTRLGR